MNVKGLKIWIVGAARSGIAAARLLHRNGADIFVTDFNKIEDDQKEILYQLNIPFEEGRHSIDKLLAEAKVVVISPSISLDKPLTMAVRQAGIPLVSEIEVASWFLPQSSFVVGITGTNGKSTTTHYAAQLFALGQRNSVACGNYGRPLADALLDPAHFNAFVVELSSYQLETTFSLRPNVSIFLNLQVDHQARYGNMDEYLKAKWRLVMLTRADGLAIIEESVLKRALVLGLPLPACQIAVTHGRLSYNPTNNSRNFRRECFELLRLDSEQLGKLPTPTYGLGLSLPLESHLGAERLTHVWIEKAETDKELIRVQATSLNTQSLNLKFEIKQPCLPGEHNQTNILVASLAAIHDGLHPNIIRAQWSAATTAYQHLPHRLEDIGRGCALKTSSGLHKNVRAINDSKATNVESTLVAVRSFERSIRLLLGGEPKGDFYGDLLPFIGKNVCMVYPFGKAAPLICEQLAGVSEHVAPPSAKMIDAAQKALDQSGDSDIILLSPACSSFDEFRNFEHRGDAFRHWVLQRLVK